jgi:hypothetical protein
MGLSPVCANLVFEHGYKYAPQRQFLPFQHLILQTETHLKFVKRFKLSLIFGGSQLIYHVRLKLTLDKIYQIS